MKIVRLIVLMICLPAIMSAQSQTETIREVNSFDRDWRFLQGDITDAEKNAFDDSKWRKLDVPHDWSIEGSYDKSHPTSRGGGYLPAGIGWYRKTFTLNENLAKKVLTIHFDGVMANSDVWINGHHLGKRPYGYISFSYDLSKNLNFGPGKPNVVAVRADNSVQPASRYYTGAGIYRHVKLIATNQIHIEQWGVFISTPVADTQMARIKAETQISNKSASESVIVLETSILDDANKFVRAVQTEQKLAAGATVKVQQLIDIDKPKLWSLESPTMYKAVTKIIDKHTPVDDLVTAFGIRSFKFEAATGFWMNGKNFKIKGVCLHHDAGALGAAVPLSAWEHRLKLLNEVGVNAIRTAHNPVAPEFLDLCDRMGFLVMDETFDTWTAAKNNGEQGYNRFFNEWWERDTRDMVMRDRNHPSIVIYSVGNEIRDNLDNPEGFKKYKDQQDLIHKLDPTRPVTMALFRPNQSKVYTNGFVETMDVVGQNYREQELLELHKQKPHLKVIGTENTHSLEQYLALRDHPFMAGQFLWTGFDYLGEADWPETTFKEGLFDRAGGWKHQSLQRQSWWSDQPVVHVMRREHNAGSGELVNNWTPTDFDTYDNAKVEVYSNCDEVELYLNGKSLGTKSKPADDSPRHWDVSFDKGTLKAVGRNKGVEVTSELLKTAGPPAKIVLSSNVTTLSNNWDKVAYIKAEVQDAEGNVCPNAINLVSFSLAGPGNIIAVDNGDIQSHELYKDTKRSAYRGSCIAIVRATENLGLIRIQAQSEGLKDAEIKLEVQQ